MKRILMVISKFWKDQVGKKSKCFNHISKRLFHQFAISYRQFKRKNFLKAENRKERGSLRKGNTAGVNLTKV
jgi:Zn-dependent M32 family carboxypeptidase